MKTRHYWYLAVIILYISFGLIEGWYDIFPWGAVILGGCIAIAEVGTYLTTRNK